MLRSVLLVIRILKASEEGYVNSFIINPTHVVGKGRGPGKKGTNFILVPFLQKRVAFYIGEGTSIASFVRRPHSSSRLTIIHITAPFETGAYERSSPVT